MFWACVVINCSVINNYDRLFVTRYLIRRDDVGERDDAVDLVSRSDAFPLVYE